MGVKGEGYRAVVTGEGHTVLVMGEELGLGLGFVVRVGVRVRV